MSLIKWDNMTRNPLWKDKALSFLARSRQELWGKHNEDILSWFFLNGFRNNFIQAMLLGWNRRAKQRPAKNWGFQAEDSTTCDSPNLFFPPGIVIPYVVDQNIEKLLVYNHECERGNPCHIVPGSSSSSMILGGKNNRVALVQNIMHALLLYQEFPEHLSIIVPDDDKHPYFDCKDLCSESLSEMLVFPEPFRDPATQSDLMMDKPGIPHRIIHYKNPEEIIEWVRKENIL